MTTRKPNLNLLYGIGTTTPWLQLAVVQTGRSPSEEHARQWQASRLATSVQPRPSAAPFAPVRKH